MAIPPAGPTSSHLADEALQPFLQSTFDPADYLNATLPPLRLSSKSTSNNSVTLAESSGQTQTLVSSLNAQATRLTNLLTQLTDDILRCGSRLAYEVDVLRAETLNLGETLEGTLQDDINIFLPNLNVIDASLTEAQTDAAKSGNLSNAGAQLREPSYLTNLKTLVHVRAQLDSVIQLFGSALQWTLPPSLLAPQTATASFISVAAPSSSEDTAELERKGKENIEKLRLEIADLVVGSNGEREARERIESLRSLCGLWKGTVEEKARIKFVDDLARVAEERLQELSKTSDTRSGMRDGTSSGSASAGPPGRTRAGTQTRREAEKGSGFLDNLSRMR